MIIIASYPRSGNHLYRFIIEYTTGKFTQGIFSNEKDKPLFNNKFENKVNPLKHVDPSRMIGIKAHYVNQVKEYCSLFNITGLHLIVRNPQNAILSEIGREGGEKIIRKINPASENLEINEKKILFEEQVKIEFKKWAQLLTLYFKNFHNSGDFSKIIIYENLIDKDLWKSEISNSLETIKTNIDLEKFWKFYENKELLFEISRTGKNRAWGSSKTIKKPNFYFDNLKLMERKYFEKLIKNLLQNEKEYCQSLISKFPGFSEYIKLIDSYL